MESLPALFAHLERFLGPVNAAWMETLEGEKCPFQVVRCAGAVKDTVFFATLGLSDHPLNLSSRPGVLTRQELLIAVPVTFGTRNIPPLLQQLGAIALERGRAFEFGEVISGENRIFPDWLFRGFYASHPCVIASDAFAECVREDGQRVEFLWMAPLYQREIELVRQEGWRRLEDLFIAMHLDLVDLNRLPAVD